MSSDGKSPHPSMPAPEAMNRRTLLTNGLMIGGCALSYGLALGFGGRYLYPTDRSVERRLLVGLKPDMPPGSATAFETPSGQTINVVHAPQGFLALSDVCPHLGCKVHWDSANSEFICPCHAGVFDATGEPVSGPPADMDAPLARFEVAEEGDLVFLHIREVS